MTHDQKVTFRRDVLKLYLADYNVVFSNVCKAKPRLVFVERPSLAEGWKVEKIQEIYLEALKSYVDNRVKPRSPAIFAKLLAVLTDLRTLGNQNSEMCFSLKLRNRKLPPFLTEIWDVAA